MIWTVVRFPNGEWSTGGKVSDPDHAYCEVYRVAADSREAAKKRGQALRSRLKRKGQALPTQAEPFIDGAGQ